MRAIERTLREAGNAVIAGVDEAGRGPLAGPVAVGCAILPDDANLPGLDDSKRMTPKSRERMYGLIVETARAWTVVMADHLDIDELGILGAVLKAMREAVERLTLRPDMAIVDGNIAPGLAMRERPSWTATPSAFPSRRPTVLAKVTRDRFMVEMDAPGRLWVRGHKGYGCRSHLDAIRRWDRARFTVLVPSGHRLTRRRGRSAPPSKPVSAPPLRPPTSTAPPAGSAGTATISANPRSNVSGRCIVSAEAGSPEGAFPPAKRDTGLRGEDIAARHLTAKGYRILSRNYRGGRCELDIIAEKGDTIVFCEVKTARTDRFGPSFTWVTPGKIRHIAAGA